MKNIYHGWNLSFNAYMTDSVRNRIFSKRYSYKLCDFKKECVARDWKGLNFSPENVIYMFSYAYDEDTEKFRDFSDLYLYIPNGDFRNAIVVCIDSYQVDIEVSPFDCEVQEVEFYGCEKSGIERFNILKAYEFWFKSFSDMSFQEFLSGGMPFEYFKVVSY